MGLGSRRGALCWHCVGSGLSSLTRDQTHIPCSEKWILNHWTEWFRMSYGCLTDGIFSLLGKKWIYLERNIFGRQECGPPQKAEWPGWSLQNF